MEEEKFKIEFEIVNLQTVVWACLILTPTEFGEVDQVE